MSLKWTDVLDIAIELDEARPEADPLKVNFVELRRWDWNCPTSTMIPTVAVRRSSRPSRCIGSKSGRSLALEQTGALSCRLVTKYIRKCR
jgi:hypothetical protein